MKPGIVSFSLLILSACQPSDVRPGLWLSGDVVRQQVNDWTFTNEIEEIFVETSPWYGIPHSTTIWCVVFAGNLYIGSYGDDKKTWENNLARTPEARLGINGELYEVIIAQVTDKELTADVDSAYKEKYDMVAVFGDDIPEWWFYQVQQRKR